MIMCGHEMHLISTENKFFPKNVLIIARDGIGNDLMFIPTFRLLKKHFSNSNIYIFVGSKGAHGLLSNCLNIKHVLFYDKPTWGLVGLLKCVVMLRRKHFDLAIVMHPGGLRSALWSFISGARLRIGFDIPLLRGLGTLLYTHPLKPNDNLHDVDQNMKILDLFGIDYNNLDRNMTIAVPESFKRSANKYLVRRGIKKRGKIIGFHPGSNGSQKWKRWPAQYFGELISMISSEWEASVLVFGDYNEKDLINEILSIVDKSVKAISVTDRTLEECIALISLCKAFIGNDSGLMHFAVANKVPTFCIAGPTDVRKTGPYGPHSYIIHSNLDCSFCYNFNTLHFKCSHDLPYRCLNELYPEEVFEQIRSGLSQVLD